MEPDELILRDHLAIDRTVLANERTFLAFIRTGLAFLVLGLTFLQFAPEPTLLVNVSGYGFILLGVVICVVGIIRYFTMRRSLHEIRFRPFPPDTDQPTSRRNERPASDLPGSDASDWDEDANGEGQKANPSRQASPR